jgi:hypothetical protein
MTVRDERGDTSQSARPYVPGLARRARDVSSACRAIQRVRPLQDRPARQPWRTGEPADFLEQLPTQRVAASLKYNYVKQTSTTWKINHLRDIEALPVAIPYTDAVVTDADVWDVATTAPASTRVWHSDLQEPHRCGDLSGPLNSSLVRPPETGPGRQATPPTLRPLVNPIFWYRYGPSVLPGNFRPRGG